MIIIETAPKGFGFAPRSGRGQRPSRIGDEDGTDFEDADVRHVILEIWHSQCAQRAKAFVRSPASLSYAYIFATLWKSLRVPHVCCMGFKYAQRLWSQ